MISPGDDRENSKDADQIREGFIHAHYLSQKDIEICATFDAADEFDTHPNFAGIESLHQSLRATPPSPRPPKQFDSASCLRVAQRIGDDDRDAASGGGSGSIVGLILEAPDPNDRFHA